MQVQPIRIENNYANYVTFISGAESGYSLATTGLNYLTQSAFCETVQVGECPAMPLFVWIGIKMNMLNIIF